MMRNEYFSDGYFDGYDWTVEQIGQFDSLNALAVRVEAKITSVPFTNAEDARQYRDGFTSGVKSVYRNEQSLVNCIEDEQIDEGEKIADRSALVAA